MCSSCFLYQLSSLLPTHNELPNIASDPKIKQKTQELTMGKTGHCSFECRYHITTIELPLPDSIKHILDCDVCVDADSGSLTFLRVQITEHSESALRSSICSEPLSSTHVNTYTNFWSKYFRMGPSSLHPIITLLTHNSYILHCIISLISLSKT